MGSINKRPVPPATVPAIIARQRADPPAEAGSPPLISIAEPANARGVITVVTITRSPAFFRYLSLLRVPHLKSARRWEHQDIVRGKRQCSPIGKWIDEVPTTSAMMAEPTEQP